MITRLSLANVAGGRFVDATGRYVDADRTADFARTLAAQRPDVVVITELDPDGDQLDRLTPELPYRLKHAFSPAHIPGVRRLGVGIASAYPLTDLGRIDLPNPPFPFLHWKTGELLEPHPKGFLAVRTGGLDLVGGQLCPVHMARDEAGTPYSYTEGAGLEFGRATAAYLKQELDKRGVRRLVLGGDLNMRNPGELLAPLGLVDTFPDPPPATTPDGRSIDRIFAGSDVPVTTVEVSALRGADHFPVSCWIEEV
ncbi:endonuclease/exonuclease/phosphatase family protein [Kribbella sp. NPDC051587]|uniref:endonuclease/exonuclease/phosphatase family protein n=1 Tax=Kribbella sp. NPDC051587 TaxID=3364119 RepID=UPI0037BA1042